LNPRLEQYLNLQSLTARVTTVMPLTGDASDRRYFRVLMKGEKPIVLALHQGLADTAKGQSQRSRIPQPGMHQRHRLRPAAVRAAGFQAQGREALDQVVDGLLFARPARRPARELLGGEDFDRGRKLRGVDLGGRGAECQHAAQQDDRYGFARHVR